MGLFAIATLVNCGHAMASESAWTPFARGDSFTYSGPVTIREYVHKWHGPLQEDGNALTYNWAETGARYGSFSLSWLNRYDFQIKANRDSATLYYQSQNKLPLAPGTPYALDIRAYHQRSWGLRGAYTFEFGKELQLESGLSILRGKGLTDGSIEGGASVDSSNSYTYDAQVDYSYSRDYIFKRVVTTPPRGIGASLDLSFRWNPTSRLVLYGQGRDLYGFIHWHPAPYTRALATSDTRSYDSSGYIEFTPTLSGITGNGSLWQHLKPHGTVGSEWAVGNRTVVGGESFITDAEIFWTLNIRQEVLGSAWFGAQTMPQQRAGGFFVQWREIKLSLMSDGLNPGEAHVLSASLQLAWKVL